MAATRWYALVDGVAAGPFTASELAGRGADLLVCAEGQTSWVAAVTFPELAGVVAAPGGATAGAATAPARAVPSPAVSAPGGASRYYAYIAGQLHGPYEVENLKPFLQPDLMVCREGSQEWVAAKDVPELKVESSIPPPSGAPVNAALQPVAFAPPAAGPAAPGGPAPRPGPGAVSGKTGGVPEAAPRDLPPLLKEFWMICRNASDDLLAEQRAKHWKKFFKNEQQILAAELGRRGIKV